MIHLKRTDSSNVDFIEMITLLDSDLNHRNGNLQVQYNCLNKVDNIKNVLVAYYFNIPVGCGCFKKYNLETAEIKRMFVKPEYRGKGIAKNILKELETWAIEENYTSLILETGVKQYEAIELYLKSGFIRTSNYGPYINNDNSICMSKWINTGM